MQHIAADIRAEPIGAYVTSVTSYRTVAINGCLLRATHTIGVAQCALRRSLRSSHPAEPAGRSCPHHWTRSGLPHPGGPRREIRHRCHLIVTSTRTSTREMVELRGFEPLTFCMPYGARPSPDGAGRRPARQLPAMTVAGRSLLSAGAWRHWLPTWLPEKSLASLMFEWPHAVSRPGPSGSHRDTGSPSAPTSCR